MLCILLWVEGKQPRVKPKDDAISRSRSLSKLPTAISFLIVMSSLIPLDGRHCYAQISAATDQEDWFLIELDGAAAGYEVISVRQERSRSAEPSGSHQRKTVLRIRRQEQSLSLTAVLSVRTSSDDRIRSWELQRSSADGSFRSSSGVWSAADRGFRIRQSDSDDELLATVPDGIAPRSPVFSTWLGKRPADGREATHEQVFFPESAAAYPMAIQTRRVSDDYSEVRKFGYLTETRIWPVDYPDLDTVVLQTPEAQTVRMEQTVLGKPLVFRRTDAFTALGVESAQGLDIQLASVIPVIGSFPTGSQAESVRLRISSSGSEDLFLPNSDSQKVFSGEGGGLMVICGRVAGVPDNTSRALKSGSVADEYLAAGRWIDWNSGYVMRAAAISVSGAARTGESALQLASLVRRKMQLSPFSTQLLPASVICRRWQGDCTEHAIVLCALLRSRGIACRPVAGFLFVPPLNAYVPHMWVEYRDRTTWQLLDSSQPTDISPLRYLKVADAALAGESESGVAMFSGLLDFVGRTTIEILPEPESSGSR